MKSYEIVEESFHKSDPIHDESDEGTENPDSDKNEQTGKSGMKQFDLRVEIGTICNSIFIDWVSFFSEVGRECNPFPLQTISMSWRGPYLPAFHSPGWMLKYILGKSDKETKIVIDISKFIFPSQGPHTPDLFESFFSDVTAGITVALTLVPQVLGFAAIANLPPIVGLYTSILPSAVYTFFGSSMCLAVVDLFNRFIKS